MRRSPTTDRNAVQLGDGRRLTFAESGPRSGVPVLYCHGAIGTPLGGSVDLDAITWRLGVRQIAVNRPGIGGSDPAAGRTVLGFAADVSALLDALALVARAPSLCTALGDSMLPAIRRHPGLLSRVIAAHSAPHEREQLARPDERHAASTSFLDAALEGVRGMIDDYGTYSRGWGFAPAEVAVPVHLWHGFNDPLVPAEHALQLAATLPDCRVFLDPDEGHHFFRRRLAEILAVLIGRPATVST
jgi:pimeloyl-ACP methyl ester carboxylesterase